MNKQKLVNELEEAKKKHEAAEKDLTKVWKEKEDKLKPFQEKVDGINKAYEKQIETTRKEIDTLHQAIEYALPAKIRIADGEERLSKVEEITTNEDMNAWTDANGIWTSNDPITVVKKKLENGIRIAKITRWDSEIQYFAFYGKKLVGYQFTDRSTTYGSRTHVSAWIGTDITKKNALKGVSEISSSSHYGVSSKAESLKFNEWISKISTMNPKNIPEIDIKKNAKNLRTNVDDMKEAD